MPSFKDLSIAVIGSLLASGANAFQQIINPYLYSALPATYVNYNAANTANSAAAAYNNYASTGYANTVINPYAAYWSWVDSTVVTTLLLQPLQGSYYSNSQSSEAAAQSSVGSITSYNSASDGLGDSQPQRCHQLMEQQCCCCPECRFHRCW